MIDKLKYENGHILDQDDNFIVVEPNARPCDIEDIINRYNMHNKLVEALKRIERQSARLGDDFTINEIAKKALKG